MTHLILYWTEPQEAPSFSNYFAVYEQADPNHDINNDFVSLSELSLAQDRTKAYSISKAHLVERGYFGPLLIYVYGQSAEAGASSSWYTEEVLYNPAETGMLVLLLCLLYVYNIGASFNCGINLVYI